MFVLKIVVVGRRSWESGPAHEELFLGLFRYIVSSEIDAEDKDDGGESNTGITQDQDKSIVKSGVVMVNRRTINLKGRSELRNIYS